RSKGDAVDIDARIVVEPRPVPQQPAVPVPEGIAGPQPQCRGRPQQPFEDLRRDQLLERRLRPAVERDVVAAGLRDIEIAIENRYLEFVPAQPGGQGQAADPAADDDDAHYRSPGLVVNYFRAP